MGGPMPYHRLVRRCHLDEGEYGDPILDSDAWRSDSWRMWLSMLRGDLRRMERDVLDVGSGLPSQIAARAGVEEAVALAVIKAFLEVP